MADIKTVKDTAHTGEIIKIKTKRTDKTIEPEIIPPFNCTYEYPDGLKSEYCLATIITPVTTAGAKVTADFIKNNTLEKIKTVDVFTTAQA